MRGRSRPRSTSTGCGGCTTRPRSRPGATPSSSAVASSPVGDVARPLVIAHRTCPNDAPENSVLGIRRAAELGTDAVEVDVRLSLEGRPVLHHDRTLRRTTGMVGPPYLRRERTITALEIGDGEHVPTFAEALDALPDGLRMAIDVKVPRAVHPVL